MRDFLSDLRYDSRYYGEKVLAGLAFIGLFLGVFALALFMAALFAIPSAWLVMLILGAIHSYYPSIPPISFFEAYLWVWLFHIIRSILFGEVKVQKR